MTPGDNSRELLAAIVDSSDDAIITKNLDGIITSWNSAAERIFGYTSQEAVGQPVTMLIPEGRLDEEPLILQRIRRGERIRHYETVRKAKNGALLNISLTVSPIITAEGEVIGASKIARDITSEVRARESVTQSEERFRITLGSIGDAVIATDSAGKITFMNRVAEDLTGWQAQQALGTPLEKAFNVVHEFTREKCENPVTKVIGEGKVVALANHTILISRDGTEHPIDDSGAPIRAGDTELKGVVLVFRDVAERRRAELTALRLAAIIQNSDDAIVGKNLQGIVTTWNEGAEKIFGYTPGEMVGQSIKKIIPPELQADEDRILARLRRGERIFHFETIRMGKDGRRIPVSLTISPIKDGEGNVIGASKIARDISERKRNEQALAEANQRLKAQTDDLEKRVAERTLALQKAVAELEAFSYSLSHDMRAPLRTIESFNDIVLREASGKLAPSEIELLKKSAESARRMDKLILDLLEFIRMSRSPIVLEKLDIESLLDSIIADRLELQPPNANVEIKRPLAPVFANQTALTLCITNLLENAVKFVPSGTVPKVVISTERTEKGVRLWFRDNGIGIDSEGKSRLFQMFQRVHKTFYPGTGIGLAIVRRSVERMHGEVGVESEPGKGSCFWLELKPAKP